MHVFIDVDIDDWRAGYQRATDFVKANNLKYSLTTDELEELGGGEKKRVRTEYYPNDFEWSQKGPIRMKRREERIIFEVGPSRWPQNTASCLPSQPWRARPIVCSAASSMTGSLLNVGLAGRGAAGLRELPGPHHGAQRAAHVAVMVVMGARGERRKEMSDKGERERAFV